ncbi:unnamed protein product [Caenorhabditis nigoni]
MWLLFLLLASFPSFSTGTCSEGFALVNGRCLGAFQPPLHRQNATDWCKSMSSTLVTIRNEEDNTAISTLLQNSTDSVWIGLYCFGNNPSDCYWDDENGSAAPFNKFAKNFPFAEVDKCVYYKNSGSKKSQWFSGHCDEDKRLFVCEKPVTVSDMNHSFNGSAYFGGRSLSFADAKAECERNCSVLASIHSASELRFIETSLNLNTEPYLTSIYIGATATHQNQFSWLDGSNSDYSKIDTTTSAYGDCLEMAVYTEGPRTKGHWYPTDCETPKPFLCKRPAGRTCENPTATPMAAPSLPKETEPDSTSCHSFKMAPGTVSSPNFPFKYPASTTCTYQLATVGPQRIRLSVLSVVLENGYDFLQVYDGDSIDHPMLANVTGEYDEPQYYESTRNSMLLVFKSDYENEVQGFQANFFSFN